MTRRNYDGTIFWLTFIFLFSIQFYVHFKIISAHMRRANKYMGQNRENPEKKHLTHLQADLTHLQTDLGMSWHVPRVGLEPTPDIAVIKHSNS